MSALTDGFSSIAIWGWVKWNENFPGAENPVIQDTTEKEKLSAFGFLSWTCFSKYSNCTETEVLEIFNRK